MRTGDLAQVHTAHLIIDAESGPLRSRRDHHLTHSLMFVHDIGTNPTQVDCESEMRDSKTVLGRRGEQRRGEERRGNVREKGCKNEVEQRNYDKRVLYNYISKIRWA